MRHLIAMVLKNQYGIRGGLKPPLGKWHPTLAEKLSYSIRFRVWKLMDALYTYSGLPKQWHQWVESEYHQCENPQLKERLKNICK